MNEIPVKSIQKLCDISKVGQIFSIKSFAVYHSGWECDETGYHVITLNPDGKSKSHHVVFTNHGTPYIADKKKLNTYQTKLQDAAEEMEDLIMLVCKG